MTPFSVGAFGIQWFGRPLAGISKGGVEHERFDIY
jgi:hypothetical protein